MKERLRKSDRLLSGKEEFVLKKTGEQGVNQIKALLGLKDLITNVNLPNCGQVKNIETGSIVETDALFRKDSITPIIAGALPPAIQSIIMRRVNNQETILKAALTKNKELAYSAFINDPLVTINPEESLEIFKTMLENTKEYLDGWSL